MTLLLLPVLLLAPPVGSVAEPGRTVAEAWSALSRCGPPAGDVEGRLAWERAIACNAAARDLLRHGDEGDRERLWDLHFALPHDAVSRSLLFGTLVDSHVADAIRTLEEASAPAAIASAPPDAAAPGFENASPELKAALALLERLSERSWPETTVPEGERISYQSDEGRGQFERMTADLLRGRIGAAEASAALDRFVWGGFCGHGAAGFKSGVNAMRLVASIREGRVDAATATEYVLDFRPDDGRLSDRDERRLMRAAGIDWEAVHVGAVATGNSSHAGRLARVGSDRSVRLLLEILDLEDAEAGEGRRRWLLPQMTAFVSSDGPCVGYETFSTHDGTRDPEAPAIDPLLQQAVLDRLERAVQPGSGLEEAQAASHALLQLCRSESAAAFRSMLESPYDEVRARGVLALRALGETVPDSVASAPVTVRLLVDGRPWTGPVAWHLEAEEDHQASVTPDRDGVLRLDRDRFLDPTNTVLAVRVESGADVSSGGTWFSLRFRPPADLDAPTLLSVRTGSLVVDVPALPKKEDGRAGSATLLMFSGNPDGPSDRPTRLVGRPLDVRPGRHVLRLQQGPYAARVLLSNESMLASPVVEVGDEPRLATLTPAVVETVEPEEGEDLIVDP